MPMTCDFPDCGRARSSGGLCAGHVAQRKKGRPLTVLRLNNPGALCREEGCVERAHGRGLCNAHLARARRYGGDPLAGPLALRRGDSLTVQWVRENVANRDREGCWLDWPWSVHKSGYPKMQWQGAFIKVAHVVQEVDGCPRPDGMGALHSCDIPLCVNPAHLRWGSHFENMQDIRARHSRPGT